MNIESGVTVIFNNAELKINNCMESYQVNWVYSVKFLACLLSDLH